MPFYEEMMYLDAFALKKASSVKEKFTNKKINCLRPNIKQTCHRVCKSINRTKVNGTYPEALKKMKGTAAELALCHAQNKYNIAADYMLLILSMCY